MIEQLRNEFNARFTEAKYAELLRVLDERTRGHVEFRVCETPGFFSRELMQRMVTAGCGIDHAVAGQRTSYMQESAAAIPDEFRMPVPKGSIRTL